MHINALRLLIIVLGLSFSSYCQAICGKVDVGAALLSVDVLESGHTVKTMHMKGIKGDANIAIYEGLCIKPGFIWAEGDGQITSGTIAVGYYLPLTKKFKILPSVGVTWGYMHTHIDIKHEGVVLFHNVSERFRSTSPFIGMELCYSITDKLTLSGLYQYAFSTTYTKFHHEHLKDQGGKSHADGPNYAVGLDYSLNKNWSVSFGLGYNITLSKEKHGLRGKGAKLGLAYYF